MDRHRPTLQPADACPVGAAEGVDRPMYAPRDGRNIRASGHERPADTSTSALLRPARRLPMSVIRLSVRAAAVLCAAAVVATPASAHAQFGKLKDLGKRAAGSVVEKKVEDEASKKVAGAANAADPGAEAKPGSVEFTEGVIEITEERLAQLAKGVDAEEAARPAAEREFQAKLVAARQADATYEARRATYDREYAVYDKRKTEIEACHDRVNRKYEHAGDAD